MQQYYLRNDMYFCEVDDGVVFLDLARNRYFSVGAQYRDVLSTNLKGWSAAPQETAEAPPGSAPPAAILLKQLVFQEVLTECASKGKVALPIALELSHSTESRLSEENEHPIGINHLVHFVGAFLYVYRRIRTSRVKEVIDHLGAREAGAEVTSSVSTDRAFAMTARFLRLRPWLYSAKDSCLLDSLTLSCFLSRYNLRSTLVIGVHDRPFSAHAWVQVGACVVNDTAEHALRYKPILVT